MDRTECGTLVVLIRGDYSHSVVIVGLLDHRTVERMLNRSGTRPKEHGDSRIIPLQDFGIPKLYSSIFLFS